MPVTWEGRKEQPKLLQIKDETTVPGRARSPLRAEPGRTGDEAMSNCVRGGQRTARPTFRRWFLVSGIICARRFTKPKRDIGGLALRVLDPHSAGINAQDTPGGIAKLEDVAGKTFYRKIFVDRAIPNRLNRYQYPAQVMPSRPALSTRRGSCGRAGRSAECAPI